MCIRDRHYPRMLSQILISTGWVNLGAENHTLIYVGPRIWTRNISVSSWGTISTGQLTSSVISIINYSLPPLPLSFSLSNKQSLFFFVFSVQRLVGLQLLPSPWQPPQVHPSLRVEHFMTFVFNKLYSVLVTSFLETTCYYNLQQF